MRVVPKITSRPQINPEAARQQNCSNAKATKQQNHFKKKPQSPNHDDWIAL
jgi:hypothetical protein